METFYPITIEILGKLLLLNVIILRTAGTGDTTFKNNDSGNKNGQRFTLLPVWTLPQGNQKNLENQVALLRGSKPIEVIPSNYYKLPQNILNGDLEKLRTLSLQYFPISPPNKIDDKASEVEKNLQNSSKIEGNNSLNSENNFLVSQKNPVLVKLVSPVNQESRLVLLNGQFLSPISGNVQSYKSSEPISKPLLIEKREFPSKRMVGNEQYDNFVDRYLPPQKEFSLENFTDMRQELLNNIFLDSQRPRQLRRLSRNSNKRNDDNKYKDKRIFRNVGPFPSTSKRFHLMHGIYKENDEMMKKALEKANNLALTIDSDSEFMRGEECVNQNQVSNKCPYDLGPPELKSLPTKRRTGRKSIRRKQDPFLLDYPILLQDLQAELNKKIHEVSRLEETIRNMKIIYHSAMNPRVNAPCERMLDCSELEKGNAQGYQLELSPQNDNSSYYNNIAQPIIELPSDYINLNVKNLNDDALSKLTQPINVQPLSQANLVEDIDPYSLNNEVGRNEASNISYYSDRDPINSWILSNDGPYQQLNI